MKKLTVLSTTLAMLSLLLAPAGAGADTNSPGATFSGTVSLVSISGITVTNAKSNRTLRFLVDARSHPLGTLRVGQAVKVEYGQATGQLYAGNIKILRSTKLRVASH
jgi:hypothetical protein